MENENWGEDILTLMDEDGVESEYRIVACAEVDGVEYMALEPINEDPEQALMEAAELVFLKVSEGAGRGRRSVSGYHSGR